MTTYQQFVERCSLPELQWFLDELVHYFDRVLAQCDPAHTTSLIEYLKSHGHGPFELDYDVPIPTSNIVVEDFSLENVRLDVDSRILHFPSHNSAVSGTSSPLAAIAYLLAKLLASTIWDPSYTPQKHSRVRYLNNTFVVLDGLYRRLFSQWSTNISVRDERMFAIGVLQVRTLEEMRSAKQVTSLIDVAAVPVNASCRSWPTNFLPVVASAAVDPTTRSECVVVSREPIHQSNGHQTNGEIEEPLSNGNSHIDAFVDQVEGTRPMHENANNTNGIKGTHSYPEPEVNGLTTNHAPEYAMTDHRPVQNASASVTLIVPSAGRSSRFPGVKPKWMLTQPSGALMIVDALGALDLSTVSHIVVGLLKEHVDQYCGGDVKAILSAFDDGVQRLSEIKVSIVVIEKETVDQVQSIECILSAAQVKGPIFLKDCDNQFACPVSALDGVATLDITRETEAGVSNVASKSYVAFNPQTKQLTSIVEKSLISNTFCIGGYSFLSASDFLDRVNLARKYQIWAGATGLRGVELAVSDIIWLKMVDPTAKQGFVSIHAKNYEDWGTLQSWRAYCDSFKTLFVDIDGTLVKNSGQYFTPTWGTTAALPRNVEHMNILYATGRVSIILVTSRLERFRKQTETQLRDCGIKYDQLLMGMLHAKRVVVNDYAATNPYPAALAVNLGRNMEALPELLAL